MFIISSHGVFNINYFYGIALSNDNEIVGYTNNTQLTISSYSAEEIRDLAYGELIAWLGGHLTGYYNSTLQTLDIREESIIAINKEKTKEAEALMAEAKRPETSMQQLLRKLYG